MKIKLAILDSNQNYLNRMVSAFGSRYAENLEIYSFTNQEMAMSTLAPSRIDILIASDTFEIDAEELPKHCSLAYFVESSEMETVNGQRAICKYQKADLIYKTILSIYAEKASNVTGVKLIDGDTVIIAFTSVGGGAGTSSMAAATALRYAQQNKKTLYLNFEKFGSSDAFFTGEGQFDMSDVIFALKSKKTNLSLKLESCVKQDKRGVYFYSSSKVALDMNELTTEDIQRLISEARTVGAYDYIILDLGFALDNDTMTILRGMHGIVWVGDGSRTSNVKIARAYEALAALEEGSDVSLSSRIRLIYNKFSNKTSEILEGIDIKNIGGAPRFEHASAEQVMEELSKMEMLDKIIG